MRVMVVPFSARSCILPTPFHTVSVAPLRQPYYSTRMNVSDIENRVKVLDQTAAGTENSRDGDKKSKAGFWEEFDVS